MRLLALSLLTLSLAACGKPAEKAAEPAPAPAASTPAAVPAPAATPPATQPQSLIAVSTTAMGITGDLELTSRSLTFGKGLTYATASAGSAAGPAPYDKDGSSCADVMGVDAATPIELRAVSAETVSANAPNGGLCGKDKTTFIALAVDNGAPGGPMTTVAAFKGANPPGPQGDALDLCGTYGYAPKS